MERAPAVMAPAAELKQEDAYHQVPDEIVDSVAGLQEHTEDEVVRQPVEYGVQQQPGTSEPVSPCTALHTGPGIIKDELTEVP